MDTRWWSCQFPCFDFPSLWPDQPQALFPSTPSRPGPLLYSAFSFLPLGFSLTSSSVPKYVHLFPILWDTLSRLINLFHSGRTQPGRQLSPAALTVGCTIKLFSLVLRNLFDLHWAGFGLLADVSSPGRISSSCLPSLMLFLSVIWMTPFPSWVLCPVTPKIKLATISFWSPHLGQETKLLYKAA